MKGANTKDSYSVLSVVLWIISPKTLIMWVFGFDVVKGYAALLKGSLWKTILYW